MNSDDFMDEKQEIKLLLPYGPTNPLQNPEEMKISVSDSSFASGIPHIRVKVRARVRVRVGPRS